MATWTNPIDYSVGAATCVARLDEQVLTNLDLAGSHTHTGSAGDGAAQFVGGSTLSGNNSNQVVSKYITFPFLGFPASPTLTGQNTLVTGASYAVPPISIANPSTSNTPASAIYLVDLDIGVWEFRLRFGQSTAAGIVGASLGGASLGQHDLSGAADRNASTPASSLTISSSGITQLRLKNLGNGSAGLGNQVFLQMFELRRISA